MPGEGALHKRTWMAFGASEKIWGKRLLPEARRNLAAIANAIAAYEPVTMLVGSGERELARKFVGPEVEFIVSPLDDLWLRDSGPIFVLNGKGQKACLDFNFNGWGHKQEFRRDAMTAALVARASETRIINTHLVLEGGGIEVDGQGTGIITESCVLNSNRNPGVTKGRMERELAALLGLKKIIWLPGIRGRDITDAHTDFYARFARPGVVLAGHDPDPKAYDHTVTARHLEILQSARDAQGRLLEVHVLEAPMAIREEYATADFAAGYLGFYVCNGAVIMQGFGDRPADLKAKQALEKAFPGREIVRLKVDGLSAGGGTIHCTTQQEPLG